MIRPASRCVCFIYTRESVYVCVVCDTIQIAIQTICPASRCVCVIYMCRYVCVCVVCVCVCVHVRRWVTHSLMCIPFKLPSK